MPIATKLLCEELTAKLLLYFQWIFLRGPFSRAGHIFAFVGSAVTIDTIASKVRPLELKIKNGFPVIKNKQTDCTV